MSIVSIWPSIISTTQIGAASLAQAVTGVGVWRWWLVLQESSHNRSPVQIFTFLKTASARSRWLWLSRTISPHHIFPRTHKHTVRLSTWKSPPPENRGGGERGMLFHPVRKPPCAASLLLFAVIINACNTPPSTHTHPHVNTRDVSSV